MKYYKQKFKKTILVITENADLKQKQCKAHFT